MLSASVNHGGPDDAIDRDKTSLKVWGLSGDLKTNYYWGEEAVELKVGDVVTIRVIEEVAPDNPTPCPVPPILVKLREREQALNGTWARLRESFIELGLAALEPQSRASLKSLIFWCAMLVLSLAMWFVAS
jgi:hypothetical protein